MGGSLHGLRWNYECFKDLELKTDLWAKACWKWGAGSLVWAVQRGSHAHDPGPCARQLCVCVCLKHTLTQRSDSYAVDLCQRKESKQPPFFNDAMDRFPKLDSTAYEMSFSEKQEVLSKATMAKKVPAVSMEVNAALRVQTWTYQAERCIVQKDRWP